MPNTNVFRGSDATLVMAVDDNKTVEGSLADALISEYSLSSIVGRLQTVQVKVDNELRPYHELGKRYPTELRPGNINVTGHAQRAHINGALVRLLLGDGSKSPPPASGMAQPSFNMVVKIKNPAVPANTSTLTLFGVKFDTWNFTLPEDEFVMELVTFKALRIGSAEASA